MRKVPIANRSETAVRIARACHDVWLASVAVGIQSGIQNGIQGEVQGGIQGDFGAVTH